MKLEKSVKGRLLIVLYYTISLTAIFMLMLIVMSKTGILAGLGASLVLGVVIGIAGGELEFRMHWRTLDKRRKLEKETRTAKKIVTFPVKETQP